MYFGLAYYPDYWPETRWPVGAQMMRDAGVNGVRAGKYAWSKLQPAPGHGSYIMLPEAGAAVLKKVYHG